MFVFKITLKIFLSRIKSITEITVCHSEKWEKPIFSFHNEIHICLVVIQIGFEKYIFNWGRWSGPKFNKDKKKGIFKEMISNLIWVTDDCPGPRINID